MHIHAVTLQNQHAYRDVLPYMYEARRRLYKEGSGWSGIEGDDGRATDIFDHDHTVYLLNMDREDRLLAACRLIPGDRPYLCRGKFQHLYEGILPSGRDVFELGRWMSIFERAERSLLQELACGVMEYSVLQGIRKFIAVGSRELVQELEGYGWTCRLIGEERRHDSSICMFCIDAGQSALSDTRRATGIKEPILHNRGGRLLSDLIRDFISQNPGEAAGTIAHLDRTLKACRRA